MAMAVSYASQPQDNPKGPRRFNHPPGGETSRADASNISQPATGPKVPKRSPWSAPSLHTVTGVGLSPAPKGKGAPTPETAVLDDQGCLGILVTLPQRAVYLHQEALGGP